MIRWYAILTLALALNAVANILMKAGMRNAPDAAGAIAMARHYLTSWPVIVGVVLFGLNVIAYTQALTKIPLSVAYPVMVSLGGLIVILGSVYLFKETVTWIQMIGFALIIGGVICVVR